MKVFHSAYMLLSLLGWVSGTKPFSVSEKISDGFRDQKNNIMAEFLGLVEVKVTKALEYPESFPLPVQHDP